MKSIILLEVIVLRSNIEVGERIAMLRTERQWTLTYLARQVGTNVKTIKDWENGVSLPSVHNVCKLCELFSTTADYLLSMDQVPTIRLTGMSEADVHRARAILQVLIDTAEKKTSD